MRKFLRELDSWLVVYVGLISAFYIKAHFLTVLYVDGFLHPLSHSLFPDFFTSGVVSLVAYFAPILTIIVLILERSIRSKILVGAVLLLSNAVLLCHINSYNDATYTVGTWVSLYLLWSATPRSSAQLAFYGKALIGLLFLGGAVGKLTAEYWDGSVLHEIYFMQKQNFPFPYLREVLSAESIRSVATGFSRVTVVAELLLGTTIFWPIRVVAIVLVPMILGMVVLSEIQLFSVVGPMLFLAFALLSAYKKDEEAAFSKIE